MWRRAATTATAAVSGALGRRPCPLMSYSAGAGKSNSVSSVVNSMLLRSLKEHYTEVSKMTPPPKVNPPSPFIVMKGSIDTDGPVLRRTFNDEEITIYVTRLATILPGGVGDDDGTDDDINQLFLHVSVWKPQPDVSLHFLCGLYPDALGIHSVSMRPKAEAEASYLIVAPSKYGGPVFEELSEKVRDGLHSYIEERGINESLFPFLQAWLYVKDHRNLVRWFKSVGTFISKEKSLKTSSSS
ncbi:hypothetical protein SAY87_001044 [Trapa incisa]|uniref:Mitochondrial glycoprotein n=1 Tax=Trapa incisa TaxID=236973 RepID=A0AAN7GN36_9MYRT|nr:hypothetical protein SAY87_001044 [Trapa incisa]